MTKKKPNAKLGRPATGRQPPMILGRINPEDRETIKAAAEASGETFTAWAMGVLLAAAKKVLKWKP